MAYWNSNDPFSLKIGFWKCLRFNFSLFLFSSFQPLPIPFDSVSCQNCRHSYHSIPLPFLLFQPVAIPVIPHHSHSRNRHSYSLFIIYFYLTGQTLYFIEKQFTSQRFSIVLPQNFSTALSVTISGEQPCADPNYWLPAGHW